MRKSDTKQDNGFEAWGGYMQAKIAKLEEQFDSRANSLTDRQSSIFEGISIYVNGYTTPSAEELKNLMSKHGGVYHTYQRSNDYIIASNLPDTKVKRMTLSKVVKPEWVVDSIKANKLLDFRNYLLYKKLPSVTFTKVTDDKVIENIDGVSSLKTNVQQSCSDKHSPVKTASHPDFIAEFYNKSRLHHISQLGACFKEYINELRDSSNFEFPKRKQLKENIIKNSSCSVLSNSNFDGGQVIMHIDMDCFFVSVGLRRRPELIGKPVAVTHSKGGQTQIKRIGMDPKLEFGLYKQRQLNKVSESMGISDAPVDGIKTRVDNLLDDADKLGSMSEIASCSYEARSKGIHNGMFMGNALKLCPDLQTIPYSFDEYKEVAYCLYDTISQYTLDIEAVSCDEMYVDCTELLNSMNVSVEDLAFHLREEIRNKTGCPCSTGFGSNKLQARLATKQAKPNGQYFLLSANVANYMCEVRLKDLPGIGRQTNQKLEMMGLFTCGNLQNVPLNSLQLSFGKKTGLMLYDQCRGQDSNLLVFHNVRKSVSAEVNYGIRFENDSECFAFLKQLSVEVHSRMLKFKVTGKCITLKLMIRAENAPTETAKYLGHGFCNVVSKSVTINNSTNESNIIYETVVSILKKQKVNPNELRGVGVQVSKLEKITHEIKGSINKYFCSNITNRSPIKLKTSPKRNLETTIKDSTSKVNKSPTQKKRGRPPKNLTIKSPKNLIQNFFADRAKENTKEDYKSTINDIESLDIDCEPAKKTSIFLPNEIKELFREWLACGKYPLPCDVKLITMYLLDMIILRNIDPLYILLKFLKRKSEDSGDLSWIEVYKSILDKVQNKMLNIYGKELDLS